MLMISFSVALFYGVSNLFGSFNAELSHFEKVFKQPSLVYFFTLLNVKTVLFQTIQCNIRTQFKCHNSV